MSELVIAGLRTRLVAADPELLEVAAPLVAAMLRRLGAEALPMPRALVIVGHASASAGHVGQVTISRRRVAWLWLADDIDPGRLPTVIAHELGHVAMASAACFVPSPPGAVGAGLGEEWMAEVICGELLRELGLPPAPFDLDDRAAHIFTRWTLLQARARALLAKPDGEAEAAAFRLGLCKLVRMWAYAQGRRAFADPTERGEIAKSATEIAQWVRSRRLVGRMIKPLAGARVGPTLVQRSKSLRRAGARFDAMLSALDLPSAAAEFLPE